MLQHFCTQIISDVYVQCSRLKTSRPVPQGSLVGYWVLPTPRHGAYGHRTCRVGRQNQFVHILKLLASQSLSYIVSFVLICFFFYFVCRAGFMQLCMLQNYHSGVCLLPYFFLFSLVIICLLSTSLSTLKRLKPDSSPELITFLQKCFFDIYSDSSLNPFQQIFNNFNEGI